MFQFYGGPFMFVHFLGCKTKSILIFLQYLVFEIPTEEPMCAGISSLFFPQIKKTKTSKCQLCTVVYGICRSERVTVGLPSAFKCFSGSVYRY